MAMTKPARILAALVAACALAATTTAQASDAVQPPAGAVRNIVLVHGAFADGSSWSAVVKALQRKGYRVTAVQNPLTSLADDVAATRRVLARQQGPVLLVGHSWAGAVITEAGNADNVKGLVYLSALVPDSGESVVDLLARLNAPMEGLQPDAQGLVWLDDPEAYRQVMAGDVAPARARVLAATQQPISASAFSGRISQAAWHGKPSWYLLTTQDNALAPRVQRRIASDIGAHVQSLASSHMSMISRPRAVADFIGQAARSATP
ncbi:MAG: Pyrethroid hydrolase [Paracidovorax wautersii]|uniref:Pyrethroid hydrolase n=1 Tax=Paracidovorax wautersii TaxID=1177982 RepID=A0A7V8FNE5_9BURK|nr:MAG: Pyrethroid hydrolase [Paracidovorax wautersii]